MAETQNMFMSKRRPFPEFAPSVLAELKEPKTFNELSMGIGVVPSTLSRTLKYLMVRNAICISKRKPTRPVVRRRGRHSYRLTQKGKALSRDAESFLKARSGLARRLGRKSKA